ncbi:hypothetical protein QE152_g24610 [Popillia japonica]|uniref:Uncharacterized protein n=1 Tax=Popillia japonica TaxID=7064 RepID=A0AAW1K368_POPJA
MLKIACTPAETPRYRFRKPITPNSLLPILGKAKIFPYISFSIESRRLRSHDGNVIRGETFRAKRKLQTSRISRIISLALYTGNNIANSRLAPFENQSAATCLRSQNLLPSIPHLFLTVPHSKINRLRLVYALRTCYRPHSRVYSAISVVGGQLCTGNVSNIQEYTVLLRALPGAKAKRGPPHNLPRFSEGHHPPASPRTFAIRPSLATETRVGRNVSGVHSNR